MRTVCEKNKCTGCKACAERCSRDAISISDNTMSLNAVIDEDKCIGCNACKKVCQIVNPIQLKKPVSWFQGWVDNDKSRAKSSSGGFASGLIERFLQDGGYVCSCAFMNGKVSYHIISSMNDAEMFRGSKYVKSDPEGIYTKIITLLKQGERVLFIGLPCHVGALIKLTGDRYNDSLFTVDLICHGSPSFLILKRFFKEARMDINELDNVFFREKNRFRLSVKRKAVDAKSRRMSFTPQGVRDRYTIAFLNGLFYTENCYECHYAGSERVSDITIGDSWGSELEATDEGSRGISLALCQTSKGEALLKSCGVKLINVDIERAVKANHQLQRPMKKPEKRELFFKMLNGGKSVNTAVRRCYPKICFRQDIKSAFIKLHLIK